MSNRALFNVIDELVAGIAQSKVPHAKSREAEEEARQRPLDAKIAEVLDAYRNPVTYDHPGMSFAPGTSFDLPFMIALQNIPLYVEMLTGVFGGPLHIDDERRIALKGVEQFEADLKRFLAGARDHHDLLMLMLQSYSNGPVLQERTTGGEFREYIFGWNDRGDVDFCLDRPLYKTTRVFVDEITKDISYPNSPLRRQLALLDEVQRQLGPVITAALDKYSRDIAALRSA